MLPGPEYHPVPANGNRDPVRQDLDRAIVGHVAPPPIDNNVNPPKVDVDERTDSEQVFVSFLLNQLIYFLHFCRRYGFLICIVLLLLAAWMTLLIFNSALTVILISLGHPFFTCTSIV